MKENKQGNVIKNKPTTCIKASCKSIKMCIHEYPKPADVACYSLKQEKKAGGESYDLQECLLYCTRISYYAFIFLECID